MKGALVLCAVLLLAAETEGLSIGGRGRCLCPGIGADSLDPKLVSKIEVFPKSAVCDQNEVIATMKAFGEKRCLNSESKKVKRMLNNLMKKRSSRKKRYDQ
ncbi:C-X-C motif chemokine 10-like [Lissotriton helveticus]